MVQLKPSSAFFSMGAPRFSYTLFWLEYVAPYLEVPGTDSL